MHMNMKKEIEEIKKRNKRVESDKAWETSFARKIVIAVLTYIVILIFFFVAGLPDPIINSLIATIAFILSTLSLPIFKRVWLEKFYKN